MLTGRRAVECCRTNKYITGSVFMGLYCIMLTRGGETESWWAARGHWHEGDRAEKRMSSHKGEGGREGSSRREGERKGWTLCREGLTRHINIRGKSCNTVNYENFEDI